MEEEHSEEKCQCTTQESGVGVSEMSLADNRFWLMNAGCNFHNQSEDMDVDILARLKL